MKLPKRIADVLLKKENYIDQQRSKMESSVIRMQSKLLNDIVSEVIPELDVKDGLLIESPKNYRLISVLDKVYSDFQNNSTQVMTNQIAGATKEIAKLSVNYFTVMHSQSLPARFEKIVEGTNKLINLRLGLDGGKLVRGGSLQSFFDSNTVGTELKQMTSKAVSSGMAIKDYTKALGDLLNGVPKEVTKDGVTTTVQTGSLERQYQRYAYDLYQQYDAAYDRNLSDEFDYKYFVYSGGLVKDSRAFCVEHNGNVYSKDEAAEWENWTDPKTGETPSYLGYPGYDPLIDRGGYNCRHKIAYISDELAYDLRPDLKNAK